jgi:hypothetical protein
MLSTRNNRFAHDLFLLVATTDEVAGEVSQTSPQLPGLSFTPEEERVSPVCLLHNGHEEGFSLHRYRYR